jgi:hypothetical protein
MTNGYIMLIEGSHKWEVAHTHTDEVIAGKKRFSVRPIISGTGTDPDDK